MEFVIIWILCALGAAAIASAKEGNVFTAFVVGLLFGPIGVLLVLISSGPSGRCPHCRKKINAKASVCPHCQSDLKTIVTAESLGVVAGSGVILSNTTLIGDLNRRVYDARKGQSVQILERQPGKVHIAGATASGWIMEKHVRVDVEPQPATKKCPRCAEMIQQEALICRFCRYEYSPAAVAASLESSAAQVPSE